MKRPYPALAASLLILSIYALRLWSWNFDRTGNVEQLLFRREALAELVGATAWLMAVLLYVFAFLRIRRTPGKGYEKAWLVLLAALSFAAFGEESSWGQKLLYFESPEWIEKINMQNETNVHNLDLARLLGVPSTSPYHTFLEDASVLLSPLFFLICYALFFFLPLMKKMRRFAGTPVIQRSVITDAAVFFLGWNLAAYFVLESLVPEADELYETALALAVLVSALDTRRTLPRVSGTAEAA